VRTHLIARSLTEEARAVDARASSALPRGEMMMAGKPPSVANYHLVRGLINPAPSAPSKEKPRRRDKHQALHCGGGRTAHSDCDHTATPQRKKGACETAPQFTPQWPNNLSASNGFTIEGGRYAQVSYWDHSGCYAPTRWNFGLECRSDNVDGSHNGLPQNQLLLGGKGGLLVTGQLQHRTISSL
jgi:hypothetical protein